MKKLMALKSVAAVAAGVCTFASVSARTLEITKENRVGGVLQSVEVAVSAGETESWLVCASGPADAGADAADWATLDPIRLSAEATTLTVEVPDGWGDTVLAMRLFLTDKLTAGDYDYAVEYVQSAGAQYIDTKYYPNKDTHLELTFSHEDTGHDQMAYGVRRNDGSYSIAVWFNRDADATLGYRYTANPMLGSRYENKDDKLGGCPLPFGTIVTFSHGLDVGFVGDAVDEPERERAGGLHERLSGSEEADRSHEGRGLAEPVGGALVLALARRRHEADCEVRMRGKDV